MKHLRNCVFAVCVSISVFSNLYAGGITSSLGGRTPPSVDRITTPAEKRVVTARDMFSLRDLGGMVGQGLSVSPDGKYVAFQIHCANLDKNDYEVGWYILNLTNKTEESVHISDAGDSLLFRSKAGNRINGAWRSTNPIWSPDSRWIAYRRMDSESVQVWRSSIDNGISEQLTYSEASVDAFWWSSDGTQIWFETDATPHEQAEYFRSKSENGVWAGDEHFDPRSNTYEIQPYELTSGRPKLWILDLSASQTREANESEIQAHYGSNSASLHAFFKRVDRSTQIPGRALSRGVTVSGDGEHIAWIESRVKAIYPSFQIHARLGRTDKLYFSCEISECFGQIRELWWDRDGREVVFSRREGPNRGHTVIYAWNIDDSVVRKIYAEDSRHLSACSSTGHSLICFSDEAGSPRIIVEVDFEDGTVTELFDPNPQFDEILVGEADLLEWSNAFGVETFGWLITPIGYEKGQRYPLVIVQYRARSCFKGGTGAEYPVHLFSAQGFVILCFDQPQLHDLTETLNLMEYEQEVWKDYYEKRIVLSSVESAIDLLDEKGLVDTTKVGITGLSSGVDTISFALSNSKRFTAAIVASLGWSPTDYIFAPAWAKEFGRKSGFGRPGTVDDKYLSGMSLGMNANKVQTPILIQVSDNEARGSMFNYVALQENGNAVDMYVFADEYHIKWHPRNRKAVAVRAVDWMRFWLKGEQDTDPAKAEQYARWQKMRKEQATQAAQDTAAGQ